MRTGTLAAVVAALFSVLGPAGSAFAACPGDGIMPGARVAAAVSGALICDLNAIRVSNGLQTLRPDPQLRVLALAQATAMARTGVLSHEDASGRDLGQRVAAASYLFPLGGGTVLENIAWADGGGVSASAVARLWMQSGTHRDNVLDPRVTDVAVGIAQGSGPPGGVYYAAEFGTRGTAPAKRVQGPSQPASRKRRQPACRGARNVGSHHGIPRRHSCRHHRLH